MPEILKFCSCEILPPLIEVVSQEKEKANDGPDALDINLNDFR